MSSLDRRFPSAARVVGRSLDGRKSQDYLPPRSKGPRNSFHPYSYHSATSSVTSAPSAPSSLYTSSVAIQSPTTSNFPKLPLSMKPLSPKSVLSSAQVMSRTIQSRKLQYGRTVVPSHLRPQVAAADRLFSWDTPFGVRHREELSQSLPPPLVNSAFTAIHSALAPNTKSTYAAGQLCFTQFCDKWEISEEDRMPASYSLLCAFIGEHKGLQSGNTIRSWMSGLRSWHIVNHAPWYGDDSWVKLARISANKEGTKHKRPLRAPVSIKHLSALRCTINISDPFHAAIFAVALCTFFGCRRLGETTVTTGAAFNPEFNVLRSVVYVSHFPLFSISKILLRWNFAHYVMVPTQQASIFLGRSQPRKKAHLWCSQHRIARPCVLSPPSRTIYQLMHLSHLLPLSLHM